MKMDKLIPLRLYKSAQTQSREEIKIIPHYEIDHWEICLSKSMSKGSTRINGDDRSMASAVQIGSQSQHLRFSPSPIPLRIDVENVELLHQYVTLSSAPTILRISETRKTLT